MLFKLASRKPTFATFSYLSKSPISSTAADKKIAIFGLNEDRNSSFLRGSAKAPSIIMNMFKSDANNTWSELDIDVWNHITDFGNYFPESSDHSAIYKEIHPIISTVFEKNMLPLCLGGDHSITYALIKSLRSHMMAPITIIHFDSHPDIYHAFEGNVNSHASQFARICEERNLISQLISIGIRTVTAHQREQFQKFNVETIEARNFPVSKFEFKALLESIIKNRDSPMYISFDIDVIEPGLAPGVSHREPGGLTVRQCIDAIHAIPGKVVGADIVEYNPDKDIDGITSIVAAKLLKEIAAKLIVSNRIGTENSNT